MDTLVLAAYAGVGAVALVVELSGRSRRAGGGQLDLYDNQPELDFTAPPAKAARPDVTIEHTPEGGTVIVGSTREYNEVLKRHGLRWSGREKFWYRPNSRDRRPDTYRIDSLARDLRAAGAVVDVEVDDTLRPTAEREAARGERLEERQERLEDRAGRQAAEADSRFAAAHRTADMIPFGQPILVGHHSEGRHRRDIARIGANMDRGVAAHREAVELERRAESSRSGQAYRETLPVTLRRIAKLEAERRGFERELAEGEDRIKRASWSGAARQKAEWLGMSSTPYSAATVDRLNRQIADVDEELGHWRAHAATLEDTGVKRWGPADFAVGDTFNGDLRVVRVNPKSLSFQSTKQSWYRGTKPYSDVRGKG